MPPKRNSAPPVMTWSQASPIIAVAVIFDLVRLFFDFFWFFGPALAAVYCTLQATDTLSAWSFGLLGAKTAAALCSTLAVTGGAVGVEITAPFGTVMAMAVGFFGWLVVGGWLMASNGRIFKENALWFILSLAASEVPFVNAIPALTATLVKMYRTQIRVEKEAYKKWEEENAAAEARVRNQRALYAAQLESAQEEQFMQEAVAEEEQAADGERSGGDEIPEDVKFAT